MDFFSAVKYTQLLINYARLSNTVLLFLKYLDPCLIVLITFGLPWYMYYLSTSISTSSVFQSSRPQRMKLPFYARNVDEGQWFPLHAAQKGDLVYRAGLNLRKPSWRTLTTLYNGQHEMEWIILLKIGMQNYTFVSLRGETVYI